jgi:hypothetical protein
MLILPLALDRQVTANIEKGEFVTAPGASKNYPKAKKLVTSIVFLSPQPTAARV